MTEDQELTAYHSYAEYKNVCQKHIQDIGGDKARVVQLLEKLNEEVEDDVYLVKVNAVWDARPSSVHSPSLSLCLTGLATFSI